MSFELHLSNHGSKPRVVSIRSLSTKARGTEKYSPHAVQHTSNADGANLRLSVLLQPAYHSWVMFSSSECTTSGGLSFGIMRASARFAEMKLMGREPLALR